MIYYSWELNFSSLSYLCWTSVGSVETISILFLLHISTGLPLCIVPVGSPSRVLDINQRRLPTLFILFLGLFLSLWPFQLYFIPCFIPTTPRFLTLFFWSYFCLIGPFNCMSPYQSLSQPWCNPLWFTGLKEPTNQPSNQPTNQPTN